MKPSIHGIAGENRRHHLPAIADLDQWLTGPNLAQGTRQCDDQDFAKVGIAGIAAGEPNDLRWRAKTLKQVDKVAVFCEHTGRCLSRRRKDIAVDGIAQA